ncbi:ATP-binding cassette sub-family B member 5 [Basidiobolus meristosporus CBS 931.73]|uniref:ATP-binding cassette sub-family B member 5 n=1 Tax=Basidiobolus meristosporus CBS 931.73 TaxID=1314790 RepID=A0A1Y1Z176_9FUNG|nr:ATP-binding cassette sub-family B member 5 [Basidiobolus meristosporus CBS 931.73]|eukprot:ORY03697.1 ATP-binding cassette sub-family B member 5 [Basidiobolus meristosporus CBS 931.73]
MTEEKENKSSLFKPHADTALEQSLSDNDAKEAEKRIGFMQLFRYSTGFDRLLILVASLCSMGSGATLPLMTVVFSKLLGDILTYQPTDDPVLVAEFNSKVNKNVVWFIVLGVATFALSYGQTALWMITGERQCLRIRQLYYAAILRQEISWFDFISSGDLTSRISGDVTIIQEGISQKVGLFLQNFTTFVGGFILAFVRGWKMALVLLSALPLLAGVGALMTRFVTQNTSGGQGAYASAGGVADEVLSSIKTVYAFGSQKREILRYNAKLDLAEKAGVKRGIFEGLGVGLMMMVVFFTYALGFWYGSRLIADGVMSSEEVLNVFFSLILGAMSLGTASPYLSSISSAQGAAAKVYEIIERKSKIDPSSDEGIRIDSSNPEKSLQGYIEFRDVNFTYPSRPDVPILKSFNLQVKPGQTVALVGSSGSGKSTCVQLLERFYDPNEGTVSIDGIDIKEFNVKDLRRNIGLVGQEPVLFGTTIYENIVWGSKNDGEIPTREEVEQASRLANAHDFISALPDKYDTLVGEKGALLSGGQKQRIAIARALIKNPRILLLDEATSALDTESEGIVQDALDKAAQDRTTIVIAHRLSTIKNADLIVVMQHGVMVESGTHNELIAQEGVYAGLVRAQELRRLEDQMEQKVDSDAIIGEEQENVDSDATVLGGNQIDPVTKLASRFSQFTSASEENKEPDSKEEYFSFGRVFKLNQPEWYLLVIGTIGSAIDGVIMPIFSVIFTYILEAFQKTDKEELKKDANFWALMFVVLGIVSLFSGFSKIAIFGIAGERLTRRLRSLSFVAYLRQEAGYFDEKENGTGVLTSKLSTEAQMVQELTGKLAGVILQALVGLLTGVIIAFVNGWKLTLVVLACVPVLIIASVLQMKSLMGFSGKTKKAYEQAAQIASESVQNMRTVASLAREDTFQQLFEERNAPAHKTAVRGAVVSSLGTGFSNGSVYLVYALTFWYGAQLIKSGEYTAAKMNQVMFAVIFSAVAVGQVSSFTGNISKARIAASDILKLLSRVPKIDSSLDTGVTPPVAFSGKVDVEHAYFSYPTRPKVPILQGFDLSVLAGKNVALVGSSGSGKSTVVALVQRFYDVAQVRRRGNQDVAHRSAYKYNSVNVEDIDVRDWNLNELRSHMATVGQEPVLFGCSIAENIAYGIINNLQTRDDGSLEISSELQSRIEEAARAANIHDFIASLPDGYNTNVGQKGTQLSGGQKQRVAIARAIIRNPTLLLLDEATSALDSESEKVVQAALDSASEGRTTITIAHRLSTIQNADVIVVVQKGTVIELGTHSELLAKRGFYHMLVNKQRLEEVN